MKGVALKCKLYLAKMLNSNPIYIDVDDDD